MFQKLFTYIQNVRSEMSKVSWPTRAQLMESTSITLVLSFMIAVFVFVVDFIVARLINVLI